MVPDRIAGVTEIPRTSRGKIDYRALATAVGMDAVEADPEGGLLPRTHEERAIARIWAALLDRDVASLGIRDDFFDLGGHSLLGTQLVAHVGRHFAVAVPLRALFDAPTIEGLALAVVAAKTELIDDGELDELLAEVGRLNDAEIDELLVDETFGRP
jgi:hypothetical protein